MANLLPNKIKQSIQKDLFNRKLVVASFALGLLLSISLIVLSAWWGSLVIRKNGLSGFSSTNGQELNNKKIEAEIKIVNNYWTEPLISTMLAKTIALKPAGLKISSLVVERGEVGKITKLSLVGLANNRNNLVNYVNLLRQEQFFSGVDLPVENLISDQGGQFVINLEK